MIIQQRFILHSLENNLTYNAKWWFCSCFFSSYGQQKHLFDMICKKQNVVMSTEQSGGKNLEVRN